MADIAYDATVGTPVSFTFTPTTGTPFGSAQAQGQEVTPADEKIDQAKMTPISGPNANSEQFTLTKVPTGMVTIKATYSKAEHAAAKVCKDARVKGILVITYLDGATDTYAGAALTGLKPGAINADNLRTDDLEFTTPLPSVFATN